MSVDDTDQIWSSWGQISRRSSFEYEGWKWQKRPKNAAKSDLWTKMAASLLEIEKSPSAHFCSSWRAAYVYRFSYLCDNLCCRESFLRFSRGRRRAILPRLFAGPLNYQIFHQSGRPREVWWVLGYGGPSKSRLFGEKKNNNNNPCENNRASRWSALGP